MDLLAGSEYLTCKQMQVEACRKQPDALTSLANTQRFVDPFVTPVRQAIVGRERP